MQVQIIDKNNLQVRRSHSASKPWDHFVHFCLILCSSYLCFFWFGKKQQKLVDMQLEKAKLRTDREGRDRSVDDRISPRSPPRCITAALPLVHMSCYHAPICMYVGSISFLFTVMYSKTSHIFKNGNKSCT